jgi:glycosyltransferase involved in cell wall biosynthesis/Tfp pilus assembly protein PilF
MPPVCWETIRALAGQGRWAEALGPLRQAVLDNPLDGAAAGALFQALGAAGDGPGQRRLARARRLLHAAAPQAVPAEAWWTEAAPVGDELASLVILCCDQLDYTRLCLESVLRHTRVPYELVLVDNGSTDSTGAYLEEMRSRPGPVRVQVLRNDENRGYPAGCNQGLAAAQGRYLVLLNNDTIVTQGWLEGLIALALHDWPHTGLVGPVSNCVAEPQRVLVDYHHPDGVAAFAERRRAFLGQALTVDRLIGFCLLIRREVLDQVGGFDERFGLGFFDDDDLCLRARQAGFRLAVALGVFVHHFGSRTFAGLGIDCPRQLQDNFARFRDKWGADHCAGYHLPEPEPPESAPRQPQPAPAAGPRPEGPRRRVSFCAIVKDEAPHILDCLRSVADLVAEMIVVDTGSTDETKKLAASLGAKVVHFPWVDSFAAARNESLRHATADWVFWMDGDERLDAANRERLRELFSKLGKENACYLMRQHSVLEAGAHGAAAVDQVRLFSRHPGLAWRYRVHEQILPGLRALGAEVRPTDIVIEHAGFADPNRQQAKVERNRRLLEQELRDWPDDPFVLYNLGAIALTQGRAAEALELVRRSLDLLRPGDSLVHKLYTLLLRCHQELGQPQEALSACRAGRCLFPHDAELLFWEGVLLRQLGDLDGAAASFRQVLAVPAGQHLTSIDAGLQGYRTRQQLAELCRQRGQLADAEMHWRAAAAEAPDFPPAWRGLAELYLEQGRWDDLEQALQHLDAGGRNGVEVAVFRARGHLARREFTPARRLLEEAIAQDPHALEPHIFLSHVLLQEGQDGDAAEAALRAVLDLDPQHSQARHNLQVLLRQQGRRPGDNGDAAGTEVGPAVVVTQPPTGTRRRVSLCMMVRNEEENLPHCLGPVADLVDEVIVVDTGSTDATREVAKRFGAKVIDFPWVDSFAAARNESLRHATGDWIFWLDADDRLDEDNRAKLRDLLIGLGDEHAAYVMQCLCLPDPATGVATAVDHVRLFRNRPDARWTCRVHEQILPALRASGVVVRWCGVVIRHTGYQDPALRHRKLERDLRLLRLEEAEQPDHPFTLFNLGSVYQELGQTAEAAVLFRRSLERSQPGDSVVRKLHAALAQCLRQLGQVGEALAVCQAGRRHYPDDVELLFQEGLVHREGGDAAGAEACWLRLLGGEEGAHFASVDTGLRGYKTRHNLGVLFHEQGRQREAEAQWRAALAERPDFLPSWVGLGELYLAAGRWQDLELLADELERPPLGAAVEAVLLRGRGLLARREFAAARRLLDRAIANSGQELRLRVLLSHVLLQEGRDWEAAERTLLDVLVLDPGHVEARHNLQLLRQRSGTKPRTPGPERQAG